MKKIFPAALSLCALSAAYGSILTPGQTGVAPDVFANLPGMTLVASETNVALNSLTFTATLSAAVYSGANAVCATSNCLTFAYQVSDTGAVGNGTGIIEDLTASNFVGYTTDVGDESLGTSTVVFQSGGVLPTTVGRSAGGPGSVVTFDYPDTSGGANNLTPGTHTDVLIVETNATNYTSGLFSAIDGATATVNAYGPTSAAPEPASMVLVGAAMIGLGLMRRRKARLA